MKNKQTAQHKVNRKPNLNNQTLKKPEFVRLNKYLAQSGLASRRKADELIESGQVTINGRKVYELGIQVDPKQDKIMVDGKTVRPDNDYIYILFNKPKNVLTSMSDPDGRPNVGDFFDRFPKRVFPVGRLDWDSEGMLILTNDGEYANKVMHPSHEIGKTYMVKIDDHIKPEHIQKLKSGVTTAVGKLRAVAVEKIRKGSDQYDWLKVTITEGRNRQIRRMFEKLGYDVKKLQRVAIGGLAIGKVKKGEFRVLDPDAAKKVFYRFDYKA